MEPTFFATPAAFRQWLKKNHARETELLVGFHKVSTGKKSITWPESVDEALCYGWIDGVRRTIDDGSYTIRFTPRKKGSNWSAVNIAKMEKLMAEGRVQPAGKAIFEARNEKKSGLYSYERKDEPALSDEFETIFKKNRAAWSWFMKMPLASYRRPAINWVMSARQEATRQRRLLQLIADSEAHRKIKLLSY